MANWEMPRKSAVKFCPFCAARDRVFHHHGGNSNGWHCEDCGAWFRIMWGAPPGLESQWEEAKYMARYRRGWHEDKKEEPTHE